MSSSFPRLAGQSLNEADGNGDGRGIDVPGDPGREKRPNVGGEPRVAELGVQVSFEQRLCYLVAALGHVFGESSDDTRRVDIRSGEGCRQVEQVSALPALVECAQLGGKELIKLLGGNVTGALEPSGRNGER